MAGLWRRLLEIVRGSQLDREAIEELTHHVDATVARLLAGVGVVATLIPSWQATRIDPVAILRRG